MLHIHQHPRVPAPVHATHPPRPHSPSTSACSTSTSIPKFQHMLHIHPDPTAPRHAPHPPTPHSPSTSACFISTQASLTDGGNRGGTEIQREATGKGGRTTVQPAAPVHLTGVSTSPETCSSAGAPPQLKTLQPCNCSRNSNNWSCWRGQNSQQQEINP